MHLTTLSTDLQAIIFDLGGTLIDWPEPEAILGPPWVTACKHLRDQFPSVSVTQEAFTDTMEKAVSAHWRTVTEHHHSLPAHAIVRDGLRRLGVMNSPRVVQAILTGYGEAIANLSRPEPEASSTLVGLRNRGLRLGLLSNTWWVADWHDRDLAAHGLIDNFAAVVYTSQIGWSKPHQRAFLEVASRLGVPLQTCLMVGDRLVDDIQGGKSAGMRTVWRRTGDAEADEADFTIDSLGELLALVDRLLTGG